MTEIKDDTGVLKRAEGEFRTVRYYVGNLRFWVIISILANLVTIAVMVYLNIFRPLPVAKVAWDTISSEDKRQDAREQLQNARDRQQDTRERQLDRRDDSLKNKELLYWFYEP